MSRLLGGARDHVVVAVTLVFPGLVALPADRVKFAELEDRETVTECAAHVSSLQIKSERNRNPTRAAACFLSTNVLSHAPFSPANDKQVFFLWDFRKLRLLRKTLVSEIAGENSTL